MTRCAESFARNHQHVIFLQGRNKGFVVIQW